ncbi:MAG: DUF1015 domain-containing protein [Candidatus Nitrospinota bacterium M3_3B_026]
MAKIAPFRGYRYTPSLVGRDGAVLAPPYDVISPADLDRLYARHPKNVARLILNRQTAADTETDNRYTRAAALLDEWKKDGTLVRDETPAIYLYAQDYDAGGQRLRRVGFIARRLAEPFGESVFPHERTLSGPKTDRLNLTRACGMNFSPVFGLYSDPEKTLDALWEGVMKTSPTTSVIDDEGVGHHLWVITDNAIIDKARDFMEITPVVIADGHHRYETALNYRNERRAAEADPPPEGEADYDYVMMYLSNSRGEGFTVLPTHRLVADIPGLETRTLPGRLEKYFDSESFDLSPRTAAAFMEKLGEAGGERPSLGFYAGGGRGALLSLKSGIGLASELDHIHPPQLRKIDVTILQEVVFERVLGISREMVADKKTVFYTVDAGEAVEAVDTGRARLAFLMGGADMEKIIQVATAGGVMPQKSTYFYPKLITGLVFNPL